MEEEWKVYKETYSNGSGHRIYEVSNLGNIKVNGKLMKPEEHRGYYRVATVSIHRAVAELFVPNPDNKPQVDHINTNPLDNRAENLRWVTQKENNNNPITKQHRSASLLGKKHSEETRQKLSAALKGKKISEETRQKLSAAHKGKSLSEETKRKLSEANKGKSLTEDTRQKMSAAKKEYWKNKHNQDGSRSL